MSKPAKEYSYYLSIMLQNRVDPFGNLIRTPARGAWMGNRGLIHNEQQQIIRSFKLKAWITCKLEFKGWKRKVMSPNRYTELFFLDEATAFAAGHRPCAECRRNDFNSFKLFWLKGNPGYNFNEKTSIKKIDEIMHQERTVQKSLTTVFGDGEKNIPDGIFILFKNDPYLLISKTIYLWSPTGYGQGKSLKDTDEVTILTPKSIVNTFQAGYKPQIARDS